MPTVPKHPYPWDHAVTSWQGRDWITCTRLRWPRLFTAVKRQGILSDSETASAIRTYVEARDTNTDGRAGCPEAVVHYGGPRALIVDAFRKRLSARRVSPPDPSFPPGDFGGGGTYDPADEPEGNVTETPRPLSSTKRSPIVGYNTDRIPHPVARIVVAHGGHSHAAALPILARLARSVGLPGATFLPGHGMAERWEQGATERATVVETAAPVDAVCRFAERAGGEFRQQAVYVAWTRDDATILHVPQTGGPR